MLDGFRETHPHSVATARACVWSSSREHRNAIIPIVIVVGPRRRSANAGRIESIVVVVSNRFPHKPRQAEPPAPAGVIYVLQRDLDSSARVSKRWDV